MEPISRKIVTFDDCNTDKSPKPHSECAEQYLDEQEVRNAIKNKKCVWLKEGNTYTKKQFADAYVLYRRECNKPLFERLKYGANDPLYPWKHRTGTLPKKSGQDNVKTFLII